MTVTDLDRRVLVDVVPAPASTTARLVREAATTLLGLVTLIALAQVVIPLPFTPVPLTLGTFGALLVGAALGPRRGLTAVGSYAVLSAAGAPVLAGFSSAGIGTVSFGYVIGYVLAAGALGVAARRGADRSVPRLALAAVAATALVYLPGALWLALATGMGPGQTLAAGVAPFLIGDALKAVGVAVLLPCAWQGVRRLESGR